MSILTFHSHLHPPIKLGDSGKSVGKCASKREWEVDAGERKAYANTGIVERERRMRMTLTTLSQQDTSETNLTPPHTLGHVIHGRGGGEERERKRCAHGRGKGRGCGKRERRSGK